MIQAFVLLAILATAPVHAFSRARAPNPAPVHSAIPSPSASPVPASAETTLINVGTITGATAAEMSMITAGVALANRMVLTPCYKQWVLAARNTETRGMSQSGIYELQASKPTHIDIEMFNGSYKQNYVWRTVGYENDPFDGVVHMNRHFVKTAYDVGDNVIHEDRGHSLDFRHDYVKSTSVPYGANYAYEGCSNQMQQRRGGKAFKPPGIRLEIRRKRKHAVIPHQKEAA